MENAIDIVDGFGDERARDFNKKEAYALMWTSISSSGGERLAASFTCLHKMTCS